MKGYLMQMQPFSVNDGDGIRTTIFLAGCPLHCKWCANPEGLRQHPVVGFYARLCIGCGACLTACPYGCRYVDVDTSVAEKCDLCASITSEGGLPQCVTQCGGMARWYGDLDEGIESFKGPRGETLGDFVEAYTDDDLHRLDDEGNDPQGVYILRHMAWQGGDVSMQ